MSRTNIRSLPNRATAAAAMVGAVLASTVTLAGPLDNAGPSNPPQHVVEQILFDPAATASQHDATDVPARLRRQMIDYQTREAAGSIIIDTPNTYLYYVLGGGKAIRYGIGVGREGFTWSGVHSIARKSEWPDWIPPTEMLARQPYLPRFMAGGPGNPLGARALYLGGTVYRIHGTNAPSTIGGHVSSGCIRMLNQDVMDLYSRVNIGNRVIVLPMQPDRRRDISARNRLAPTTTSIVVAGRSPHGVY